MFEKNKKILGALILLVGLSFIPSASQAIGLITEPIVVENALRGQEATATLKMFNAKDSALTYALQSEGAIAGWARFYRFEDYNYSTAITAFEVPAQSYGQVRILFTVPNDTPNGTYTGQVTILEAPPDAVASDQPTVKVQNKIGQDVSITVTDQETVILETQVIPASYDLDLGKPLKITVIYDNRGNITLKPDLQLRIYQDDAEIYNAIFPYPATVEAVRPGRQVTLPEFTWQTQNQSEGEYQAIITVKRNGQILKEESFRFRLRPAGEVAAATDTGKANKLLAAVRALGWGNLTRGWIVLGAVLIGIAAVLAILKKLRGRQS